MSMNFSIAEFLQRLEELRAKSGLSKGEFGVLAGVQNIFSRYGDGRGQIRAPSTETLLRVAEAFDVSVDWLLTGREQQGGRTTAGYFVRAHATGDQNPPTRDVALHVGMAWSVLESGKGEAFSLKTNIQSFYKQDYSLGQLVECVGIDGLLLPGDKEEYLDMLKRKTKKPTQCEDQGSATEMHQGAVNGGAKR